MKNNYLKKLKKTLHETLSIECVFEQDDILSLFSENYGLFAFVVYASDGVLVFSTSLTFHDSFLSAFVAVECSKLTKTEVGEQFYADEEGTVFYGERGLQEYSKLISVQSEEFSKLPTLNDWKN